MTRGYNWGSVPSPCSQCLSAIRTNFKPFDNSKVFNLNSEVASLSTPFDLALLLRIVCLKIRDPFRKFFTVVRESPKLKFLKASTVFNSSPDRMSCPDA